MIYSIPPFNRYFLRSSYRHLRRGGGKELYKFNVIDIPCSRLIIQYLIQQIAPASNKQSFVSHVPPTYFDPHKVVIRDVDTQTHKHTKLFQRFALVEFKYNIFIFTVAPCIL